MSAQPKTRAITIEIEEDLAERFQRAADDRGISLNELIIGFADWSLHDQEFMADQPFTPEQIAQIEESLAQAERGETVSNEEVMARLKERFPDETGRQIIERALESYSELMSYVADMPDLHEDWDAQVAKGLAEIERGDVTPQHEVFARWRAKYG